MTLVRHRQKPTPAFRRLAAAIRTQVLARVSGSWVGDPSETAGARLERVFALVTEIAQATEPNLTAGLDHDGAWVLRLKGRSWALPVAWSPPDEAASPSLRLGVQTFNLRPEGCTEAVVGALAALVAGFVTA